MRLAETRAKVSEAHRARGHRPKVLGGNGRPMSRQQATLAAALGVGWATEKRIRWREKFAIPAYLIDIYHEECKVAVEVDGKSHLSLAVQSRDARKTRFLERLGWLVLRVLNEEIDQDLDRVVASITCALQDRARTFSAAG
jgi:very-short-patch-repair endonuclease